MDKPIPLEELWVVATQLAKQKASTKNGQHTYENFSGNLGSDRVDFIASVVERII